MKLLQIFVVLFLSAFGILNAQVKEYYITCDSSDFALIYENYEEDIYIPATVTYEGQTWEDTRMRIRGDGSRKYKKKSLKIKFDGDLFYTGRETLNLNADIADKSYMHAYLSSLLFNQTGYPCFESEHVRLYLNGEYLGLYIQIENMDEDFLTARGLDPNGNLYKATVDGASLRLPDEVDFYWEKKTNTNSDMADLRELIEEINSVPEEEYYDFMINTFDYDNVITNLAMNILIGNASTYYHNYYMYHDINNTGKWMTFPWDLDKTISHYGYGLYFTVTPGAWAHDNPLIKRSLICEPVFNDIKAKLAELTESVFNEDELFPVIDSLRNALEESVLADTTDNIEVLSDWEALIAADKEYISNRYNHVLSQFDEHPELFEANTTRDMETGDVLLTWHPSSGKQGREISYIINYGPKPHYDVEGSVEITGIVDTFYVLKADVLTEGNYYWQVRVTDGTYLVTGFDHHNKFTYQTGTTLPCNIDEDMTLTEEGSPYSVNCDVTVADNVTLTIEEGVHVEMLDSFSIVVKGNIMCNGTEEKPIYMYSSEKGKEWGFIWLQSPDDKCEFRNMIVDDGHFYGLLADTYFENITINNNHIVVGEWALIYLDYGTSTVKDCYFYSDSLSRIYGSGEGVIFEHLEGTLENCIFDKVTDAIQVNVSQNCIVRNNLVVNAHDDAIDLNQSDNIYVENNRVFNSQDKGLSVSGIVDPLEERGIHISNNLVAGCEYGINQKENSIVILKNNTFYKNNISISMVDTCSSTIINNIVAGSVEKDFNKADGCTAEFRYNLCDNTLFDGTENQKGEPGFIDPENNDFRLVFDSPCINAGDPDSPNDPDGTRADIGAYYFNLSTKDIVINEINYNSPDDFDAGDWVELYNPDSDTVVISGWYLKDDNISHIFTLPENTFIGPDDYLVVCNDTALFRTIHGNDIKILGNMDFGLSGNGDQVRLYNLSGLLIDSVEYDDTLPWPEEPDGNGPSLELIDPEYDNSIAESWAYSNDYGTPGKINDSYYHESVSSPWSNTYFILYPNPANEKVYIEFDPIAPSLLNVSLIDITGNEIKRFFMNKQVYSGHQKLELNLSNLRPGMYYLKIENGVATNIHPLIILN